MKILNLTANSKNYTCHVYLILGDWNTLDDVNTLIDAGRDPNLIHIIRNISTCVGKKPLEQVILTHSHYDHTGMITEIKKEFNPLLYAYLTYQKADIYLKGGEKIKIADRMCEMKYLYEYCDFDSAYQKAYEDQQEEYNAGYYPDCTVFEQAEMSVLSDVGGYPTVFPWLKKSNPQ